MTELTTIPGGKVSKTTLPRGISGKELLKFSGTISKEDARMMAEVIEECCERVDPDSW